MKKKCISVLLCLCMIAGVFTGCGKKESVKEKKEVAENLLTGAVKAMKKPETTQEAEQPEEPKEPKEPEEKIYSITTTQLCEYAQKFFQLNLGCYVNYYLGNCKVEPTNISNMLKHTNIVGTMILDEGMCVVSDYNDTVFALKQSIPISSYANRNSTISYSCSVNLKEADFSSPFRSYENTDELLHLVIQLNYYINNQLATDDIYALLTFSKENGDTETWLLQSAICFTESDYKKVEGNCFTGLAVDEPMQRKLDKITGTGIDDVLKVYQQEIGDNPCRMIYLNDDEIPECIYSYGGEEGIITYINGEVDLIGSFRSSSISFQEGKGRVLLEFVSSDNGVETSRTWETSEIYELASTGFNLIGSASTVGEYTFDKKENAEKVEYSYVIGENEEEIEKKKYDEYLRSFGTFTEASCDYDCVADAFNALGNR